MSLASKMLIKFLQLSGMKRKLAKGSQKTFEEAVSYFGIICSTHFPFIHYAGNPGTPTVIF